MTHEGNMKRNDGLGDERETLDQLVGGKSNLNFDDDIYGNEIGSRLSPIAVESLEIGSEGLEEMEDPLPPEHWFSLKIIHKDKEKGNESNAVEEKKETEICNVVIIKSWSEFKRFHNLLITDEFGCVPAVKNAIMPLPTFEDETSYRRDEIMAETLCSYFDSILEIPEVRNSSLLSGFLDEWSLQGSRLNKDLVNGHYKPETNLTVKPTPITAVDFLLQPFESQKLYIHRRSDYNRDMIVLQGESIVWSFDVQELDIDFSVDLYPDVHGQYCEALEKDAEKIGVDTSIREKACEMLQAPTDDDANASVFSVHNTTRYSALDCLIQGSFTANQSGLIRLTWSNKFSRLRGKNLSQLVRLVGPKELRSAVEASDVIANKTQWRESNSAVKHPIHTISIRNGGFILVTSLANEGEFLNSSSSLHSSIGRKHDDDDDNNSSSYAIDGCSSSTLDRAIQTTNINGKMRRTSYLSRILHAVAKRAGYILVKSPDANNSADGTGTILLPQIPQKTDIATNSLPSNEITSLRQDMIDICARYNRQEDELAIAEVKRSQEETRTRLMMGTLLKKEADMKELNSILENMEADRLVSEQQYEHMALELDESRRNLEQSIQDKEKSDYARLKVDRENAVLRSERNVWQMARSGIQDELSKIAIDLALEKQSHSDTRRLLARAQEALRSEELENYNMAAKLKEQANECALEKAKEEAKALEQEAEDSEAARLKLEAEISNLRTQKHNLVCELKMQIEVFQDKLSAINAEAEEARMMQRTMQSRLKALEEECEAHIANGAENEIKIQRLRAEKKILISEIRKGSTPYIAPDSFAPVDDTQASAPASLPSLTLSLNPKCSISQLSKQIVYLRKRKMQLKEQFDTSIANNSGSIDDHNVTSSLSREMEDIDRTVMQLQSRVKRLMSTEQREGCGDEGSIDPTASTEQPE